MNGSRRKRKDKKAVPQSEAKGSHRRDCLDPQRRDNLVGAGRVVAHTSLVVGLSWVREVKNSGTFLYSPFWGAMMADNRGYCN